MFSLPCFAMVSAKHTSGDWLCWKGGKGGEVVPSDPAFWPIDVLAVQISGSA